MYLFGVAVAVVSVLPVWAGQQAPADGAPAVQAPAEAGRQGGGRQGGQAGRQGGGLNRAPDGIPLNGMPAENVPKPGLLFREGWNNLPIAQPITQAHLANQHLTLHLYGDTANIRKSNHEPYYYTYTGETRSNWALTVSDRTRHMNFLPLGKVRVDSKQSGWRVLHVVIRTADGNYYVSEEGVGETVDWITVEWHLRDLHWRTLVVNLPNAPARWGGAPPVQPIVASARAQPDLSRVDEVGFSDLMPGGLIPSSSRIRWFEVYADWVPRDSGNR
jgi:hypothetical protein